jgi:TPR repeat protein
MFTVEEGDAAIEAQDYQRAFQIFMSLAQAGDITAQITVAGMYLTGQGVQQDSAEAAKWYYPAAEKGHLLAQHSLAVALFDSNLEEAIRWLFITAEKDVSLSQSMLGDIYSGSYNLPDNIQEKFRNTPEAIKWYKKAGENGFSYAYHRLGEILSSGQAVEKDERQAIKYYQEAAQEGYEPSQEILGQAYADGLLTLPKDSEQSQYWLTQAREGKGMPLS